VAGRILAIAAAQEFLSATAKDGVSLADLVAALVTPLAPDASRLRTSGPSVILPSQVATPFALVLHELSTNALKHGAWSSEYGHVHIAWRAEAAESARGHLVLMWHERDGARVAPAVRQGLGSALIKDGLPGAQVSHDLNPEGLTCQIVLPL
jgi:two-component system CheB/CheR fusion protein